MKPPPHRSDRGAAFPPTEGAADNLQAEGVGEDRILVTSNTVIDALLLVRDRLATDVALRAGFEAQFPRRDRARRADPRHRGHRRENFDGGARARLAAPWRGWPIAGMSRSLYPVHLNPEVQRTAQAVLGARDAVHLIPLLDYLPFVHLTGAARPHRDRSPAGCKGERRHWASRCW